MEDRYKDRQDPANTGVTGNSPDETAPVSFARDIVPLFNEGDIACMSGMGILLDEYAYMSDSTGGSVRRCGPFDNHAHSQAVYASLTGDCSPQMPFGGPFWTETEEGRVNLEKLKQWMDQGYNP